MQFNFNSLHFSSSFISHEIQESVECIRMRGVYFVVEGFDQNCCKSTFALMNNSSANVFDMNERLSVVNIRRLCMTSEISSALKFVVTKF